MRRRGAGSGVRAQLASEYRRVASVAAGLDGGWHERFAQKIDAGELVEVHGYEVGWAGVDHVRVEPDGSVVPVTWNPATSELEVSE